MKLKVGDEIQLFGNSYMKMMGIPIATGKITQVRKLGDGFTFDCNETKFNETIEDDDGEVRIL
jgi:hypothetical protein